MSRNEEIKAKAVEIQEDHYDGYYSGHIESYQQTAIDAATWADETMIKKACEWLRENVTNYEVFDPIAETYYQEVNILIDDFKKAMEE